VAVLVAAGDIADCGWEEDSATAALIQEHPDAVVAAIGDLVYPNANTETFDKCFDPAWGALRDRIRPAVGNHDLAADAGAAYWSYFGTDAGAPGEGWYSYDHGAWHVVVLNSNCDRIGCQEGSPQHAWLIADLAAADAACTLAYWHHARFTSGRTATIRGLGRCGRRLPTPMPSCCSSATTTCTSGSRHWMLRARRTRRECGSSSSAPVALRTIRPPAWRPAAS
jgi:hypothetical protein